MLMRRLFSAPALLTVGMLWVGFCLPLSATIIYDNTVNDLTTRFNPGTLEVGDEIILAGGPSKLQTFSFEFWGTSANSFNFAGNVQARVRFYENNGAPFNGYSTPGTVFYDSSWFQVPNPTSRSTFVFSAGSDFAPHGLTIPVSDMTWSVQFQGLGSGDAAGVDLYSPPVVGQNFADYWENDGGVWKLKQNPNVPIDFAAKMAAAVPDATGLEVLAIGVLSVLAFHRLLKYKGQLDSKRLCAVRAG